MLSATIILPAIGAVLMAGAGVATYGTAFFWLWLIEASGLAVAYGLAFRGEA
jgi:hypothetical protein